MTTQQEELLNTIKATKTYLKKSNLTSGDAFRVTLTHNKKRCCFIFNDNYFNESNKIDFVRILYDDATCYSDSCNFEDFCYILGYSSDSLKAYKIYKKCKKQHERLKKLFNDNEIEIISTLDN